MNTPESATLTELLAAGDPASVAIIDGGPEPRRVTREQLWRRVLVVRDELEARGVDEGDCVGVWLPNWSDALVWQFAAAGLGAHVIGINTRYGIAEVAHVLDHARPKVLAVAHDFLGLDLVGTLCGAAERSGVPVPSVAVIAGPGGDAVSGTDLAEYDIGAGAWTPMGEAGPAEPSGTLRHLPDALAVAFTTSGSTGMPKLAAHRGGAVAEHARNVAAAGGWDAASVSLVVLPLSGVFGYVPAITAIGSGGAALLEPRFDPDLVLRHMAEFDVTHLACADDVVGRLAAAWWAHPIELPRWRRMLMADFYGDSHRLSAWAEDETHTSAMGVYGSSEVFALAAFWDRRDTVPARWRGGGRPVSERFTVRAVDPVTGEPPSEGEPGELQFRGYPVVDAYLGDDDGVIRARSFTDDGWFRSGDLGVVHADGSFDYLCRMGDSLRLKGFLVEPAEIEARLAEHASVARAKVVGVPLAGETHTVAFVEPDPDGGAVADPDALRAWCEETLAAFKVPHDVRVIDDMPMTAGTNGSKIRTAALRELAERIVAGDGR
ncbi:fatty-acyl-CoA synthase [Prauserella sediminis]|uniref:Long-chain-fatty-acid--CoA ligase n=1 Tax=Prauserella sediminis TaxID=577680 RepID=A0A839Y063_9PSEU|nr:AMP-binding protein [Prauserella sediminis]MBB3665686.1 fatty-acyl-CoA synthase [Prauserella sediminis]